MKRISIAIPDQLHRDLKTLAVYQDETLTSLVTRLLKSHLGTIPSDIDRAAPDAGGPSGREGEEQRAR